jgi:hypothetical protein
MEKKDNNFDCLRKLFIDLKNHIEYGRIDLAIGDNYLRGIVSRDNLFNGECYIHAENGDLIQGFLEKSNILNTFILSNNNLVKLKELGLIKGKFKYNGLSYVVEYK